MSTIPNIVNRLALLLATGSLLLSLSLRLLALLLLLLLLLLLSRMAGLTA
jgi:hypothetical protein